MSTADDLRALDELIDADARWVAQLAQARTTDEWDQLLDPSWPAPAGATGGRQL
jgi:hypothetical protein